MIENDPTAGLGKLAEWLPGAGLATRRVRAYAGEALPASPEGYAAVLVLGLDTTDGPAPAAVESLLRRAVRARVATLGIGLGAQLLATAHGGLVAPAAATARFGPALVARRDAAGADPLFAPVPFLADVVQWHTRDVVALPAGAVVLASATHQVNQAFRVGPAAWGVAFHIQADAAMVATWVDAGADTSADADAGTPDRPPERAGPPAAGAPPAGNDPVAATAAVSEDLDRVWKPFAARFAALARGELPTARPELPLREQEW